MVIGAKCLDFSFLLLITKKDSIALFLHHWKTHSSRNTFNWCQDYYSNPILEPLFYEMFPPFYKGTTDYMDRFIDEQDSSRDRSSSPNFYSLMFGGSDGGRKGLSLYPGASSKSSFHLG